VFHFYLNSRYAWLVGIENIVFFLLICCCCCCCFCCRPKRSDLYFNALERST